MKIDLLVFSNSNISFHMAYVDDIPYIELVAENKSENTEEWD
jgi:hypothetical protein